MKTPDIPAAEQFLAGSGRVLERRLYERAFAGGAAEPVRDAVTAYRNPDGGFGHALEPDTRCPGSQPLATDFALQALYHAGAWDHGLALGACGWLAVAAPAAGGATFVNRSLEGWPHAPWMVPAEGDPPSLIGTGLLAGTLHAGGVSHPWLTRATALLWDQIEALTSTGPYDLRALLWFIENVPDTGRARAALDKLGPMISDQGLVTLEPGATGEIHTPLDFAPRPGSPARGLFEPALIDAHLDHLAADQRDDGGWMFNWQAWSPAAERDWRGSVTVTALSVLRANGRC